MIISILFFFIFWSIPWYFPFGIDPESRPWRPYLTMSQRVTTIFAFCCIFSDFLHVVWSISLFGHGPWTLKPWVQTVTTISIFFWFFLIFWILFGLFPFLDRTLNPEILVTNNNHHPYFFLIFSNFLGLICFISFFGSVTWTLTTSYKHCHI